VQQQIGQPLVNPALVLHPENETVFVKRRQRVVATNPLLPYLNPALLHQSRAHPTGTKTLRKENVLKRKHVFEGGKKIEVRAMQIAGALPAPAGAKAQF
jgi:hypothetical protein